MRLAAIRLEIAFWSSLLLLTAATAAGITALLSQNEALRWVVHTHEVIEQLERTSSTTKDAETGQRGFLLTGEDSYLLPYNAANDKLESELARLDHLTGDNVRQQQALTKLRDIIRAKMSVMAEALALYRSGDAAGAISVVRSGRGAALMDEMRVQVALMAAEEQRLLDARTRTAARYRIAGWVSLLGIAALALTLLWMVRFIARRDQAELRASEERLATTLSSIGDGVIATDTQGRIERMNAVAERMTGWSLEEARGKPLDVVFPIVDEHTRMQLEAPVHKVLRTQQIAYLAQHTLLISRDGRERSVEDSAAPIRGRNGALEGVVLVFHDVSARRRAERGRIESERRYRHVLESLPQMVWTCNSHGAADFLSRQWLQYTGSTLDSERGFGWTQRLHPEDRERLLALWDDAVRNVTVFDSEARIRSASGTYRWFKQRAVPLLNPDGTVKEWFGTSTDITDVIEARESVRRANVLLERRVEERTTELEEANSELQAFAHSVAHDLRAPLRNIQGYASAILEDEQARMSEEGAMYAQRMADSALRLDRLIQDLLAYSRLSRAQLTLERVDLGSWIRRVLQDMSTEFAAREAQVSAPSEFPAVLAHGPTLGQALTNLLSNAVKFVAVDVLPKVNISVERVGDQVRLTVADNGIGIAREHQERIFRVFERLHGSERYPGTGIGLAIVRRGIERMGGRVWVESAPNAGARFQVELKAASAQ